MVGGDLVDVIACNGHWLAYVADVSGHGVPAGVLMAMIKSSMRTAARLHPGSEGLLEEVNDVLCSLKAPNMFATLGFVTYSPNERLHYSLAGHLPILRWRDEKVDALTAQNLPLGVFLNRTFETKSLDLNNGEVLAIISDGLTEIFNKNSEELGFTAISDVFRDKGTRPLAEIGAAIFNRADRHGPRSDDQSLLLIRRMGGVEDRKRITGPTR
jgi:sigma-B regulation protein RsbU (phosphoserine phosphatase)